MKLTDTCTACRLATTRNKIVWGEGPIPAVLMLAGEAPGKWENNTGRPFVEYAKAGEELTHILHHKLGIPRNTVYITNSVKCRPPNNRTPKQDEIDICTAQHLKLELELVSPKVVGAVGRTAARYFLGDVNMERIHGIPYEHEDGYIVVPLFHPAAAIREPSAMLKCHADFEVLAEVLRGQRSPRHIEDEYLGKEQHITLDNESISH